MEDKTKEKGRWKKEKGKLKARKKEEGKYKTNRKRTMQKGK
jgi:hypothetical protein